MDRNSCRCVLISDFNLENLAAYLQKDGSKPTVQVIKAPYGQVVQPLLQSDMECWQEGPSSAVVWTRPEKVIQSFGRFLEGEYVALEEVMSEVDQFANVLLELKDRASAVYVSNWVLPPNHRGLGMLDLSPVSGCTHLVMQMNVRLAEQLAPAQNIFLLDAQRWMTKGGENAFNPKLWYLAKTPYSNTVFKEAVRDIKSAMAATAGLSKKLIVLDLDDTLWGGIVGEVGWEKLRLGGHDHVGEAFVDFQKALKRLTRFGIVLGIVSKNEESVALEAMESHPEMVLRRDDFAGWRINWQDKARNIVDLVAEIGLGLESVVFIDDSPVERSRVAEALPEVFVPEWPKDKMLYASALHSLRCFEWSSISEEDRNRSNLYAAEHQRKRFQKEVGSLDEWVKSLNLQVSVEELNGPNLSRTAQLLNKTNQMNLTTRRMTDQEILAWCGEEGHMIWTFRAVDRFGDSGLVGIASLAVEADTAQIVDFVLSCRVMGRRVEETMLHAVIAHVRKLGLTSVFAECIPTKKNKPCQRFFRKSGLRCNGENTFTWDVHHEYPCPESVSLVT